MKIIIAPDKFKGSLTAAQAAQAIADGIRDILPDAQVDLCPMADGGEGTVDALVAATGGRFLTSRVTGPLPDMKVDARFGFLDDGQTAVIEMSAASGLALLAPADRNPLNTTTYGTGELINAAIRMGARRIILGIGGSATTDAGIGCAQATGHTIVMEDGQRLSPSEPLTGADLTRVRMVKRHRGESTDRIEITVACDVTNPLFGPNGAAKIFAPQKGATPAQVEHLDAALQQLASRANHLDLADHPGAGAAGGLGFGMLAFYGASLRPGIDIMIEATKFPHRLDAADLCITGEGRLDEQTLHGKTISGISRLCHSMDVPCIALAGSISPNFSAAPPEGLTAWFSIIDAPMPLEDAIRNARPLLTRAAANVARIWQSRLKR